MKGMVVGFLVVLAAGFQMSAGHAFDSPAGEERSEAGFGEKQGTKTGADAIDDNSAGDISVSHRNVRAPVFLPLHGPTANLAHLSPAVEEGNLSLEEMPPTRLDRQRLPRIPLFWRGTYLEIVGITIEFPTLSKEADAGNEKSRHLR